MTLSRRELCAFLAALPLVGCNKSLNIIEPEVKVLSNTFSDLMGRSQKAAIIAEGFQWSEGPVWDFCHRAGRDLHI